MDVGDDSISIIYRDEYNIHLLGMEKLHPFDACKWGNVVKVRSYISMILYAHVNSDPPVLWSI